MQLHFEETYTIRLAAVNAVYERAAIYTSIIDDSLCTTAHDATRMARTIVQEANKDVGDFVN